MRSISGIWHEIRRMDHRPVIRLAADVRTRPTSAGTQTSNMSVFNDAMRWLGFERTKHTDHIPNNTNYEKGVAFEKYVIGLFDPKYFALHEWTRDISGKTNGYTVESDSNPDLVMRYKPRDELFAVECKFRSSLYKGALHWTSAKKLTEYQAYAKRTGYPTYVVIGLSGSSDAPDRMFCIPLSEAKYPDLYPSVFEGFERSAYAMFFWDGKDLE